MNCSTTVQNRNITWIIAYVTILPSDNLIIMFLSSVSVKLVDLKLGITYTGIVYILRVTILSRVRSKDLLSQDTTHSLIMTSFKYRARHLFTHMFTRFG